MKIALITAGVVCFSHALKWTSSRQILVYPQDNQEALKHANDEEFMGSVRKMEEAAMPHAREVVELMYEAFDNFTSDKPVRAPSILTQIGSHMKTKDVLSADSYYIGIEVRCELSLPFSPGFEFEIAFVIQTDTGRSRFCLALQGGADFELDKAWGMAEKHDKELLLAIGGAKFDLMPIETFQPILEYGGQAKIGTTALDATVDVDLMTKRTFMVGTEIDVGSAMAGIGKSLTKNLKDFDQSFFSFFQAQHGTIDAEIAAGGMQCWDAAK